MEPYFSSSFDRAAFILGNVVIILSAIGLVLGIFYIIADMCFDRNSKDIKEDIRKLKDRKVPYEDHNTLLNQHYDLSKRVSSLEERVSKEKK